MLSLHKKIESNWKGYANMKVPVKVLQLLSWRKTHLHVVSFYKYRASEKKNNSNILCLFLKKRSRVNR